MMKPIIIDYPPMPSHEDHSDLYEEIRKLASEYKITFVTARQQIANEELKMNEPYRDEITKLWSDAKNDFSITANDLINSFVKIAKGAYIQGLSDGINNPKNSNSSRELAETFFKDIQVKFMLSEAVEELAKRIDAIK